MTRRIYLAGPMTGYPEHNYPEFRRVSAWLRGMGHYVYSPHERLTPPEEGADRLGTVELRQAFADYCRFICLEADTLLLLKGWEESRGAKAEYQLAKNCDLEVLLVEDVYDMGHRLHEDARKGRIPSIHDVLIDAMVKGAPAEVIDYLTGEDHILVAQTSAVQLEALIRGGTAGMWPAGFDPEGIGNLVNLYARRMK